MNRSAPWLLCSALILLLFSHYWILHQPQRWLWRAAPLLPLSPQQEAQLKALPEPHLEIYLRQHPRARRELEKMLMPLRALMPLRIQWINPDLDPLRAQARDIQREGQIYVGSGEQGQRLDVPSLAGVVDALLSFGAEESAFLLHLQGHGERDFLSDGGGSWQALYRMVLAGGGKASAWRQDEDLPLPDNAAVLLLADPQEALPPAHQEQLRQALQQGKHLIYSSDSHRPHLPEFIREISGLEIIPGRMVGLGAARHGFEQPEFMLIEHLGDTELSRQLKQAPLLPTAVAFREALPPAPGWQRQVLFWSGADSWSERDLIRADAELRHDPDEEARGPLPLAYVLQRPSPRDAARMQYLIILGDSDAASHPYFHSTGNAAWWQSMLQWLDAKTPRAGLRPELADQFIHFSEADLMPLGWLLFGLALLPLGFLWRRRPA